MRPCLASRSTSRLAAPRLPALFVGVVLFGLGIALMVQADLGLGPWEALNQGIARQTGLQIGTVSILLGIPILAGTLGIANGFRMRRLPDPKASPKSAGSLLD